MKKILLSMRVLFILFAALGSCFLQEEQLATAIVNPDKVLCSGVIGLASYYSYECADAPMANGQKFNPESRTCASWFYDFGTVLVVKSLDTGLATEVVVTDRGPNKRLVKKGRILDLSKAAFQDICKLDIGLTKVIIIVKNKT